MKPKHPADNPTNHIETSRSTPTPPKTMEEKFREQFVNKGALQWLGREYIHKNIEAKPILDFIHQEITSAVEGERAKDKIIPKGATHEIHDRCEDCFEQGKEVGMNMSLTRIIREDRKVSDCCKAPIGQVMTLHGENPLRCWKCKKPCQEEILSLLDNKKPE